MLALDASGNDLRASGGVALAEVMSELLSLRLLLLGYNGMEPRGGLAVASSLAGLTALEVLDLQANSLGTSMAEVVKQLHGHRALRELRLQYNEGKEGEGATLAAAVAGLVRLEVLDLDGNRLSVEALEAVVAAAEGLTALQRLDLQRNSGTGSAESRARLARLARPGLELVLSDGLEDGTPLDG